MPPRHRRCISPSERQGGVSPQTIHRVQQQQQQQTTAPPNGVRISTVYTRATIIYHHRRRRRRRRRIAFNCVMHESNEGYNKTAGHRILWNVWQEKCSRSVVRRHGASRRVKIKGECRRIKRKYRLKSIESKVELSTVNRLLGLSAKCWPSNLVISLVALIRFGSSGRLDVVKVAKSLLLLLLLSYNIMQRNQKISQTRRSVGVPSTRLIPSDLIASIQFFSNIFVSSKQRKARSREVFSKFCRLSFRCLFYYICIYLYFLLFRSSVPLQLSLIIGCRLLLLLILLRLFIPRQSNRRFRRRRSTCKPNRELEE